MDDAYLDTLQWNEAEANGEMYRGLILLFASGPDGQPGPIGTGFIVFSSGRRAVAITAAHVLSEVRRLQAGERRHNRTALDMFLPPPKAIDIDRKKLWAMTRSGDDLHILLVTGVAFDEDSDIASLTLVPNEGAPDIPLQAFAASSDLPPVGSPICVLSFGDLGTEHFKKDGDAWELKISLRPILRAGRVTAHYPDGNRLCKGPCIETSIPVYSGMSGGPVFALGSTGQMKPVALVCSDPDPDGPEKQDRTRAGASIMAVLPVKVVLYPNNNQHTTFVFKAKDYAGDMHPTNVQPSFAPRGHIHLAEFACIWELRLSSIVVRPMGKHAVRWSIAI